MSTLSTLLPEAITHISTLGPSWLDPQTIIRNFIGWLGPFSVLGVFAVVFAETGLLVGFFLPGDSLLFTLGMFTASGEVGMPLWAVALIVFVASFAGDQTGYWIGRTAGPKIFDKPDSRLFKREYVEKTNSYFARYGGRTLIMAKFIPIVRTFAPVAAGVGHMNYRRFISYNVIGGMAWAPGCVTLGYFLGQIPFVQKNIEFILVGIVLISVTPMLIEVLRKRAQSRKAAAATPSAEDVTTPVRGVSTAVATEPQDVPVLAAADGARTASGTTWQAVPTSSPAGLPPSSARTPAGPGTPPGWASDDYTRVGPRHAAGGAAARPSRPETEDTVRRPLVVGNEEPPTPHW